MTWWVSLIPLIIGLVIASAPLHGQHDLAAVLDNVTGNVGPYVLINSGLAGIGLRAAL
jgi:hypothetical protein